MHFNDALINAQQFFSVAEIWFFFFKGINKHLCILTFHLPLSFLCFLNLLFSLYPDIFLDFLADFISAVRCGGKYTDLEWEGVGFKHLTSLLQGVSNRTNHSPLACWLFQKYHSYLNNCSPLFCLWADIYSLIHSSCLLCLVSVFVWCDYLSRLPPMSRGRKWKWNSCTIYKLCKINTF